MSIVAKELADAYSIFEITGTSFLAFKNIPELIEKYVHGTTALDFGCGCGRSTRFLFSLGLNPIGVDNCPYFIKKAKQTSDGLKYILTKDGKIPFQDGQFDLVFSSFVLLMISSKKELLKTCQELCRVMKKDATCIIITGSHHMHSPKRKWVSYDTNFPENDKMSRGSPVKLKIKETNAIFQDYNWYDQDYQTALKKAGFKIIEKLTPIAPESKEKLWLSENKFSPFFIYVVKRVQ